MENIRAYTITHNLKEIAEEIHHIPENIIEDDSSVEWIREKGFQVFFATARTYKEMQETLEKTISLKQLELVEIDNLNSQKQIPQERQIILDEQPVKMPKSSEQVSDEKGKRGT